MGVAFLLPNRVSFYGSIIILVVIGDVVPVPMNLDGTTAMPTGSLVPLRLVLGLATFTEARRMVPVFVDKDLATAVFAIDGGPLTHQLDPFILEKICLIPPAITGMVHHIPPLGFICGCILQS
jgi:hypothetical protein